jgi:hypothetical protein
MVSAKPCDDTLGMKNKMLILTCLSGVALASGLVTGCVSDNYHQGASTGSALTHSSEMITKSSSQIDDSLAALNDLVSHPQPDLRKQFDAYENSVNMLDATAKDITSENEAMQARGAAYFNAWDDEIATMHNEDIRSRSEARRNQVAARFASISQQYDAARIDFQPYLSDLHDVQKSLSTDLTSGGLSAITEIAAKTTRDAAPLKETLARLSQEFKDLGIAMSPTTAAN